MNLPFRLGAERTLKSFYNNSLLNNTLLSIIEPKCSFTAVHLYSIIPKAYVM